MLETLVFVISPFLIYNIIIYIYNGNIIKNLRLIWMYDKKTLHLVSQRNEKPHP